MKALLLSNINMQPLIRVLKPWDVACGLYDSMLPDLSIADSPASAQDITHVFCLFDSDTLMGEAFYGANSPDQCEHFLQALDLFCSQHPGKIIVVNTFAFSSNRWLNFADATRKDSLKAREAELNAKLVQIAESNPNLLLLDIELLIRRHGEETLVSNAFWYTARIRYTARMFDLLAEMIRAGLNAHAQRCKKVLILDLDDTLWGGVVGELGPFGITLSEEKAGRCYRDFQRCIRATTRTGTLLAIVSKNNEAEVQEVFEKNDMMILRREDFVAVRANWKPKAENIVDIAEQLNLGIDSFVYIDDNPVEREAIKKFLPEVIVPDFPQQPESLAGWFTQQIVPTYFGKYAISHEDVAKTRQYHANAARQKLAESFDLDTYLAELGIECSIEVDPIERLTRAAQMTQKTNQFNLTTRRYDVTDLDLFVKSHEHAVLMLNYRDRFGDEGAVSLAIVNLREARIDTLLSSCRVIGRNVEARLLDKAIELCRFHGHHRIIGEYIPTRKNQVAADFYSRHGFIPISDSLDGRIIYGRDIND